MPSICNTENNDQMNKKSNDEVVEESINGTGNSEEQNGTILTSIINGFTEEDIDDELPVKKNEPSVDTQEKNDQNELKISEDDDNLVNDDSFNIKISVPGLETFELTVCQSICLFLI